MDFFDLKAECSSTNGFDLLPLSPEPYSSPSPDPFYTPSVCTYKQEDPLDFFTNLYDDSDLPLSTSHPPIFLVTYANPAEETRQSLEPEVEKPQNQSYVEELLQDGGTEKKSVGALSPEARKAKIQRYLEKRSRRNFSKKIAYQCRKKVADNRVRVKGRFVTKSQEETLRTCQ